MLLSLWLWVSGHDGIAHVREYTEEIFLNPFLPLLTINKLNIFQVLKHGKILERKESCL